MKEYKQPETRIKVVTQGEDVKYYPQYKVVIINCVWSEWLPIRAEIFNKEFVSKLEHAKERIDLFLVRDKEYYEETIQRKILYEKQPTKKLRAFGDIPISTDTNKHIQDNR